MVYRIGLLFIAVTLTGCGSVSLPTLDALSFNGSPGTSVPPTELARSTASFSISSLKGVPDDKVGVLSQALDRASADKGLSFFNYPGADKDSDYVLLGYFLSSTTKGEDEVTYVWDLVDRTGNRVGRASGSARVQNGVAGLPGGLLTPAVLKTVSEDAIAQILAASRVPKSTLAASQSPVAASPQGQQVVVRR